MPTIPSFTPESTTPSHRSEMVEEARTTTEIGCKEANGVQCCPGDKFIGNFEYTMIADRIIETFPNGEYTVERTVENGAIDGYIGEVVLSPWDDCETNEAFVYVDYFKENSCIPIEPEVQCYTPTSFDKVSGLITGGLKLGAELIFLGPSIVERLSKEMAFITGLHGYLGAIDPSINLKEFDYMGI